MKRKSVSILLLLLMVVALIPSSLIFSVSATSDYDMDFEEGDLSDWTATSGAGISASGDAAYSGDYGCESDLHAQSQQYQMWKNITETTYASVDFWIQYDDVGTALIYDQLRNIDEGDTFCAIRPNGDTGFFRIGWMEDGSTQWEDTSQTFAEETWYNVKMSVSLDNSTGWVRWYLNGTLLESKSDIDNYDGVGITQYYTLNQNGANLPLLYRDDVTFDSLTITAVLEDIDDDGADWVFTNWKYYDFTVYSNIPMVNCSIAFILDIGVENAWNVFYSDASNWIYATNQTYETIGGEPCQIRAGTWNYDSISEFYTVTFGIFFNDVVLDLWDAADGVDVYATFNSSNYFLVNENFFRIYNKGGFEMNTATAGSSGSGKLVGGTPFSLYAYNGSSAYNEIWYRDLQHMKLLPDISFSGAGLEQFSVYYGIDYSLGDGEWLPGWYVRILPDTVSYTGILAGNVWINMSLQIWNSSDVIVTSENLYMFYHGSVSGVGDPGHWKIWVDLWFSDKNANSVAAARVNAYEFPMIDSADLWLRWLANNWGVKDDVLKQIEAELPLLDGDDAVISTQRTKMIRAWCNVTVSDNDAGQYVSVENYEAFDITHSRQLPLVGMSSPVFDETLIPTVNQRGMLGALWSMFSGLGQWLSENVIFGGLNLWSTFVDFLDTIAGFLGAPDFFTNLFTWIGQSVGYIGTAFDYLVEIVVDVFALFGSLLGAFLETMGELITSLVNTVTIFTDMMGGAYGTGVDLWETLGISSWLTVAMVFYPLYLIILWEEKGMDAVIQQLTWIFGLLSWVFTFMSGVIMDAIGLISTLIESIPVAE